MVERMRSIEGPATLGTAQSSLTVDPNRYAEKVIQQRNAAQDLVAQLSALAEDLLSEREQLQDEVKGLREENERFRNG